MDRGKEQAAEFEGSAQETSNPVACRSCCQAVEEIDEVLIVHHEALRKVDFLLKYNELTSCDSPTLPACVNAVKHARIERACAALRRQMPADAEAADAEQGGQSSSSREHGGAVASERMSQTRGFEEAPEGAVPSDGAELSKELGKHLASGRQQLLQFLHKMSMGLEVRFLEDGCAGASVDVLLRLLFMHGPLVFSIEGEGFVEYVPLAAVSCVHIGSREEVFGDEDPMLCMTLWTRHKAGLSGSHLGGDISSKSRKKESSEGYPFNFIFPDLKVREEFQRGMKLLQQHKALV